MPKGSRAPSYSAAPTPSRSLPVFRSFAVAAAALALIACDGGDPSGAGATSTTFYLRNARTSGPVEVSVRLAATDGYPRGIKSREQLREPFEVCEMGALATRDE
jgi:hypothetical protein